MSAEFLLLACSQEKNNKPGRADAVYCGAVFKLGIMWADKFGVEVKILSAKYGLIDRDTFIEPYNEKLRIQYSGPWPSGDGLYLGGPKYFGLAPKNIQPLVPFSRYGEMCAYINMLLNDQSREDVFKRHSSQARGSIISTLYCTLRLGWYTKEQLYQELVKKFGDVPSMKKTIAAQLSGNRLGLSRGCEVLRSNDLYHIDPDFSSNLV